MQGLRKLFEYVSVSAALLSGVARADDESLVYPLNLEHSACPDEALVAASAEFTQAHRKFSVAQGRPYGSVRAVGIPTLDAGDDRPVRRSLRGSRFRQEDSARNHESSRGESNGATKVRPIETPLREVEEGSFPLLPYFESAGEAETDGSIELAGFLDSEPNPTTCPREETPVCDDEECSDLLQGEAAGEILALRKRMGPALGGTAFDVDEAELAADPDRVATRAGALKYLVETIRLLERENGEEGLAFDVQIEMEPPYVQELTSPVMSNTAREALRDAAERVEAAANQLERQDMFSQADDLRRKADELRQQARGVTFVGTTCGGRSQRPALMSDLRAIPVRAVPAYNDGPKPTVRSPRQCPAESAPGIEACPANACPAHDDGPSGCATNTGNQPIVWTPRTYEFGATHSFEPYEAAIPSTRPNPYLEQTIPWWNLGYPVTGPCGASSGIRVGMSATSTARDAIRVRPGEAAPRGVIERLPPIVESQPMTTATTARTPGRLPSVEPAYRIPGRSSLDAIADSIQWERQNCWGVGDSKLSERERLTKEVRELNILANEAASQSDGLNSSAYVEALRWEVARLRKQLERTQR